MRKKACGVFLCFLVVSCTWLSRPSESPLCEPTEESLSVGLPASKTVQRALYSPMLIGGAPANPADWPASVYMHAGSSSCSSTLIGDRVLLSAAHCMSNGARIRFTAGANNYTARCTHHSEYRGNETADWALCLVDRPVIGVVFEKVATSVRVKVGDQLRLTGYGCIKSPGLGGNDGIFRIGMGKVTALPSDGNYDIVTEGPAALCFGDSGGAAFDELPDGNRTVTGLNSRGDIETVSYLSSVASVSFQKFAKDFASRNGVKVCGLHSSAVACRSVKPAPPADSFEYENSVGCVKAKLKAGHEAKKSAIFDSIKKALDSF